MALSTAKGKNYDNKIPQRRPQPILLQRRLFPWNPLWQLLWRFRRITFHDEKRRRVHSKITGKTQNPNWSLRNDSNQNTYRKNYRTYQPPAPQHRKTSNHRHPQKPSQTPQSPYQKNLTPTITTTFFHRHGRSQNMACKRHMPYAHLFKINIATSKFQNIS